MMSWFVGFFHQENPEIKKLHKSYGIARSPKWSKTRRRFLKDHPACAVCGCTKSLEVHHLFPVHFVRLLGRPDLELDLRNLVALCDCKAHLHHLLYGHLGSFQRFNKLLCSQVTAYAALPFESGLIKTSTVFQNLVSGRPKMWEELTPGDKIDLIDALNRLYPIGTTA